MGRALAANTSITHLSLARNRLGGGGIGHLTPGLLSLRSLDLSECGIASAAGAPVLSILLRDGQLTSLLLWNNELGPAGGSLLAAGVALSTTLQRLQLAGTAIGDSGASAIAGALSHAAPLRHLDVSACGISGNGVEAVFTAVAHGAQLQSLSLSGNSSLRASSLAYALQQLPAESGSLTELDLTGVPAAADSTVVASLAAVHSLRTLTLFACGLGGSGAGAVAAQLTGGGWPGLQELDLGGNGIDADAMTHLLSAVRSGGGPALQVRWSA